MSLRNLALLNTLDACAEVYLGPYNGNLQAAMAVANERIQAHSVKRVLSDTVAMRRYYTERFIGQMLALVVFITVLGVTLHLSSTSEAAAVATFLSFVASVIGVRYWTSRMRTAGVLP